MKDECLVAAETDVFRFARECAAYMKHDVDGGLIGVPTSLLYDLDAALSSYDNSVMHVANVVITRCVTMWSGICGAHAAIRSTGRRALESPNEEA